MTSVLYIGETAPNSTSRHRADALARLGHKVRLFNPLFKPRSPVDLLFNYRTGYIWGSLQVGKRLTAELSGQRFDLVLVNGGEWINRATVRRLRELAPVVINYNNDDPLGGRDGMRWSTWRRALPAYDVMVTVRGNNVAEARAAGARDVLRVWMSCDEVAHRPRPLSSEIQREWASEVAFVGTWMPERGSLLAALVRRGIPLSIWGNRWFKAPEWAILRPFWRGPAVEGDAYAYAIQCAKVALGLVSKGNRDQHTQRSAEIPYLGTPFCCENTSEHRELFGDRIDAWLFDDPASAAVGLLQILGDPGLAATLARNGRQRVVQAGLTNEKIMGSILDHVSSLQLTLGAGATRPPSLMKGIGS